MAIGGNVRGSCLRASFSWGDIGMAVTPVFFHSFDAFKPFSAYVTGLQFLLVIPAAGKVIGQMHKIDAKAPHRINMHGISLIDNATFFKLKEMRLIFSVL